MSSNSPRLLNLYARDPHCHWCHKFTVLYTLRRHEKAPDDMATLDHLYSRLNPERKPNLCGEERTVLACWGCNFERGKDEYAQLSIEEKRKRSNHHEK